MPASRDEYTRLIWVNDVTPLSAENLNHLEQGVKTNNALAKENALFIDEIYTALIEQLSLSFNAESNILSLKIGSATGQNPTSRFNKEINIEVNTHTAQIETLARKADDLDEKVVEVGSQVKVYEHLPIPYEYAHADIPEAEFGVTIEEITSKNLPIENYETTFNNESDYGLVFAVVLRDGLQEELINLINYPENDGGTTRINLYTTGKEEDIATEKYGYDSINFRTGKIVRYCRAISFNEFFSMFNATDFSWTGTGSSNGRLTISHEKLAEKGLYTCNGFVCRNSTDDLPTKGISTTNFAIDNLKSIEGVTNKATALTALQSMVDDVIVFKRILTIEEELPEAITLNTNKIKANYFSKAGEPCTIKISYLSLSALTYSKEQADEKFIPFSYMDDKTYVTTIEDTVASQTLFSTLARKRLLYANFSEGNDGTVPFYGQTTMFWQRIDSTSGGFTVLSKGKIYWWDADGVTEKEHVTQEYVDSVITKGRLISDLAVSCPPITYGIAGGDAEITTGVQKLETLYGNTDEEGNSVKSAALISRGKNQFQGISEDRMTNLKYTDVIGGEEYKIFGLPSGFMITEYDANKQFIEAGMDQDNVDNYGTFTVLENTRYIIIEARNYSEVTDYTKIMLYNTFGEAYDEPYEEPIVHELELPNIELRKFADRVDEAYYSGGGLRRIGCIEIGPDTNISIIENDDPESTTFKLDDATNLIVSLIATSETFASNTQTIEQNHSNELAHIYRTLDSETVEFEIGNDEINDPWIYIYVDKAMTVSELKQILAGVQIFYPLAEPQEIPLSENPGWDPHIFIDNYGTLMFVDENGEEISVEQPYQIIYKADLIELLDSIYALVDGDASQLVTKTDLTDGKVVPFKSETAEDLSPYSEESGTRSLNAFAFQTSGGNSDVGSKAYLEKLTGQTVKFKQLVHNGNFANGASGFTEILNARTSVITNSERSNELCIRTQGTSAGIEFKVNLKNTSSSNYVLMFEIYSSDSKSIELMLRCSNGQGQGYYKLLDSFESNTSKKFYNKQFTTNVGDYNEFYIQIRCNDFGHVSDSNFIKITNIQIFDSEDLEQSLGSEWNYTKIKKTFPLDYYESTEGKFIHSKSSAYKITGYNALDENWEMGNYYYDSNSRELVKAGGAHSFRSKKPIRVVPEQEYVFAFTRDFLYTGNDLCASIIITDANNNVLQSYDDIYYNQYISIPQTGYYAYIYFYDSEEIVEFDDDSNIPRLDCCFHLRWDDSKSEYEKHYEETYRLPNIELRKWKSIYDELRYDGTLIRRVSVAKLDELNWTAIGNATFKTDDLIGLIKIPESTNDLPSADCERKYTADTQTNFASANYKFTISSTGSLYFYDEDNNEGDVSGFKESIKDLNLIFVLNEPQIENSENYKFTHVTDIDDFGTQEFISDNKLSIPQGCVIFYPAAYKAFIDSLGGRPDISYDASNVLSKKDYNKSVNLDITERRIFVTRDVFGFKKRYVGEEEIQYSVDIFMQSYSLTRSMNLSSAAMKLHNKQKLRWSEFKETKKGNFGIMTLCNGEFEEGLSGETYVCLYETLLNEILHQELDGQNVKIELTNNYREFDTDKAQSRPQVFDKYEGTKPLSLSSKNVFKYTITYANPIHFNDFVNISGEDIEINRKWNDQLPGSNYFISLHRSFDFYSAFSTIKIAGKAFVKFGMHSASISSAYHNNQIVARDPTIVQNSYLELQALYIIEQDLENNGLIESVTLYVGVTPKQFKK